MEEEGVEGAAAELVEEDRESTKDGNETVLLDVPLLTEPYLAYSD